ncbi:hypothetical protein LTR08_008160 [Meristemomyces frigidus]|nr:hypothetical protein LTR08_008160 [Meristemomyces frigidus]
MDLDEALASTIKGAYLDLDLWLLEWQGLVSTNAANPAERSLLDLNLRIQHAWAVLALHLRALTACGIENIAIMTVAQRSIALAAKAAAERHLTLLLATEDGSSGPGPYVANFRYAMEFVWAKNVFCVLIVLRLGILLEDPLLQLALRLQEAREFLRELANVGMGVNVSYTRILAQTVGKCERAVKVSLQEASERNFRDTSSDDDFQSFVPKEFVLEWDFQGLNLCYIPVDWQDLFFDFGAAA